MGTWEVGPFENDAAADFVVDFADKGWQLVQRAINRNLKRDDWAIQELVAACEFVVAANGYPLRGNSFDELNDWSEIKGEGHRTRGRVSDRS